MSQQYGIDPVLMQVQYIYALKAEFVWRVWLLAIFYFETELELAMQLQAELSESE